MAAFRVSEMYREIERRRMAEAAKAFMISLVVHVALFVTLSTMAMRFTTIPPSAARMIPDRIAPLRLVDVKKETEASLPPRVVPQKPGDVQMESGPGEEVGRSALPPDKVAIQPPPLTEPKLAGEKDTVAKPTDRPRQTTWDARQEVIAVEKKLTDDGVGVWQRATIPQVERVGNAPDVALPVDSSRAGASGMPSFKDAEGDEPGRSEIAAKAFGGVVSDNPDVLIGDGGKLGGGRGTGGPGKTLLPVEKADTNAAPRKALERLLIADLYTYEPYWDSQNTYFRVEISRIGEDALPVIPKDIMLVQDSSNSMAEQRLHFCREGLARCLAEIGTADRFNVARFREGTELCFPDWVANTPENVEKAKAFISEMLSAGNTDILKSTKDLLNMTRTAGRPAIALLITDGRSTTGERDSSDIIGEFSKVNDGAISIFAMGTVQTAEEYLLDLISYCNRGSSFVVTTGRWDIPDAMVRLMREFRRPVLSDVRFRFAGGSQCEVYPFITSNLYLDKPLVVYGRHPRGTKKVVFQALGKAGDVLCDMVFDIDVEKAAKGGDSDIRQNWARQKVYSLIGQYARTGEEGAIKAIEDTSKAYKLKTPYKSKLQQR